MPWVAAALAAASILSSMLNKKKGSSTTSFSGSQAAEGEKRLLPSASYNLGNYYYPGLLPKPTAQNDLAEPALWAPPPAAAPTKVPGFNLRSGSHLAPTGFGGTRAQGGPVKPGKAYVTGEKGPEKLVPTSKARGTSTKSKDRLGALSSAMLDESLEPRKVPGDFSTNRFEGYPTSGLATRSSMAGLGQPHTEAPNAIADFLARVLAQMPHRAAGGPVAPGGATVVGETGPEVIVPDKPGTVIPHEASGLPDTGAAAAPGPMGAEMGGPGMGDLAEGEGGEMPPPGFGSNGGPPPPGGGNMDPLLQFVLEAVLEKLATMMGGGASAASMGSPPGAAGGGTMSPPGGGLFGGGAPPSGGIPPGIPGRAGGGLVRPGRPYGVGERGPELYQPQDATASSTRPIDAMPGATTRGTVTQPAAPPTYGAQVVSQNQGLIANPGQLSSTTYERGQEQANRGEMMAQNSISGLAGRGIDTASTGVGALRESAALSAGKQRNEAARDYGLTSEALRRSDIAAASEAYRQMLDQMFGLQKYDASIVAGVPPTQTTTQSQSPYGAMASGLGVLSNYLSNSQNSQQQAWQSLPQQTQQYGVVTG